MKLATVKLLTALVGRRLCANLERIGGIWQTGVILAPDRQDASSREQGSGTGELFGGGG
jgi:hypothetical protein